MDPTTAPSAKGIIPSAARPARLITYAWGERYLDDLLTITLPAALAPGNLPYLASAGPCEVVLLTEEKFKSRVDRHPTVRQIRRFCPLHVVGLDDLVHAKDKYGMTLTYALHRGLIDLGSAVTETNLFFLNADFVVAENSFRAVLSSLRDGKRLIAAPSYCVNYASVVPALRSRLNGGTLAFPHRELADLALCNLHNTVCGKTLNQHKFHLKQIDQFYWQAGAHTLLGHQMPIAIVGMRPEREVIEPNSFWDHGLINEFCPTEEPHVLGDSDDFLMIELREKEVAREQIAAGQVDPQDAGRRMIGWVTPYQRSFAPYELTLHSKEIPLNIDSDRAALSASMKAILAYCPAFLPSHLGHPQWNYHLGTFMAARHRYLSQRLGAITEEEQPPANSLPIDRIWWLLDGSTKRYERKRTHLQQIRDVHFSLLERQIDLLSKETSARQEEINRRFIADVQIEGSAGEDFAEDRSRRIFSDARLDGQSCKRETTDHTEALKKYEQEFEIALTEWEEQATKLARIRDAASKYYARELNLLNDRALREHTPLEKRYALATSAHVTSAQVPLVQFRKAQDRQIANDDQAGTVARFAAQARYRLYRGPLQRIRQILSAADVGGTGTILLVTSDSIWVHQEASRFSGSCALVTMTDLLSGNFVGAIDPTIKFDLCLCELAPEQLFSLDKLAKQIEPCLKPGARILGLHWHTSRGTLSLNNLRSLDTLALRVFVDQFPPATASLVRDLGALPAQWRDRKLFGNIWRRLKHAPVPLTRLLIQKIATKARWPFRKSNVAVIDYAPPTMPHEDTILCGVGTAITVELIPTAQSDVDRQNYKGPSSPPTEG